MFGFWSVFRTEFGMSIRRKGLIIPYLLLFVFYLVTLFAGEWDFETIDMPIRQLWGDSAQIVSMFNVFYPVLGGIAAADRLIRDQKLNTAELLRTTLLTNPSYLLGKYFGVLASLLAPILVFILIVRAAAFAGGSPWITIPMSLVEFVVMSIPAFAFVTAFSLVCPLILPLRVYQVLFTGYWFWGNLLNPEVFPTLSGTLLEPVGFIALEGLFGYAPYPKEGVALYTPVDVGISLCLVFTCIVLALVAGDRILRIQSKRL
jgi:hypothetical protein